MKWRLTGPRGDEEVTVRGRADTDEFAFVRAMLVAGFGIGLAPVHLFAPLVETGALERVLPRYALRSAPVHLVWPSRHFEPAAVTRFRDALADALPRDDAPGPSPGCDRASAGAEWRAGLCLARIWPE